MTYKKLQRTCPKCGRGPIARAHRPCTLLWDAKCQVPECGNEWIENRTGERGLAQKMGIANAKRKRKRAPRRTAKRRAKA